MRINRYLASVGVASRRKADTLIAEGRVTINNAVAKLSDKVDPSKDMVCLNGEEIKPRSELRYYLFYKPVDVITSVSDDRERKTVMEFIPEPAGLFPVGRLDFDAIGAILITNDGDLAYRLTHPKFGIEKIYIAEVLKQFTPENAELLKSGIELEGVVCRANDVEIIKYLPNSDISVVRVTMTEGRKREVKELLKAVGNRVVKLKRISFAGLTTEGLEPGQYRKLEPDEVAQLRNMVQL